MALKDVLIQAASSIGSLLYLSRLNKWNLDFEGMTFRFGGRRDFEIDLDRQIEHLRGRSQGTPMPELAEVKAAMVTARQQHAVLLAHTRGCDLCEVLSKGVHDVFGRNHLNLARGGPAVEEVIRTAYSRESFQQTQLYASIKAWEAKRTPLTIF